MGLASPRCMRFITIDDRLCEGVRLFDHREVTRTGQKQHATVVIGGLVSATLLTLLLLPVLYARYAGGPPGDKRNGA